MKVLKEVRDEKNGIGTPIRYLCWECDKCGETGFFSVADDVKEIPEDRKKHCEEKSNGS